MESINTLLQDEVIRHQLYLQGFEAGGVLRMLKVLAKVEAQLMPELLAAIEDMDASDFKMSRLESLMGSIKAMSTAGYQQIGADMLAELHDFTEYEVGYQQQMLVHHLPAVVHVAAIAPQQVYAAAMARPFQGVLLKGVWKDLSAQSMKRVQQTIAMGVVSGKTTEQIVREVKGTKANNYTDGLQEKSRRDVRNVVRTAIGHTAGFVQDKVMEANDDLIKAVKWSSTLDLKTSPPCRIRDGLLYKPGTHEPIGHKVLWLAGPGRLHWCCRSGQVPVLKSFKDMGIDIPEVDVDGRTRASLDGQIPADTTYPEWIKRQSAARQDDVLGPTRGKLMREGRMSLEEMYTKRGIPLTLDELRKKDEEAFKRAGI